MSSVGDQRHPRQRLRGGGRLGPAARGGLRRHAAPLERRLRRRLDRALVGRLALSCGAEALPRGRRAARSPVRAGRRTAPPPGRASVRISATTSSAVAPPVLTITLACLGLTWAPPTLVPLRPAASSRRPAESPGGFLKIEPAVGCPEGSAAHRRVLSSSILARSAAGDPWRELEERPRDDRAGRLEGGRAVGGLEIDDPDPPAPAVELDQPGRAQDVLDFGAVAAGVHEDGAADGRGEPRQGFEAGEPRRRRLARHEGERRHRHRRSPGEPRIRTRFSSPPSRATIPGKPASGTRTFEPRPRSWKGSCRWVIACSSATRARSEPTSTKISAGPPIRRVGEPGERLARP